MLHSLFRQNWYVVRSKCKNPPTHTHPDGNTQMDSFPHIKKLCNLYCGNHTLLILIPVPGAYLGEAVSEFHACCIYICLGICFNVDLCVCMCVYV